MATIDQLMAEAARKRDENMVLSRAYQKTLNWLMPANFFLVIGAAILSLVAGTTILTNANIPSGVNPGVLALISSAFTIVHSKLGCEEYQSECKKLMAFHRGIASDYDNLLIINEIDELKKKITILNDQLSVVLKSTTALPFGGAIEKAKKHIQRL